MADLHQTFLSRAEPGSVVGMFFYSISLTRTFSSFCSHHDKADATEEGKERPLLSDTLGKHSFKAVLSSRFPE